MEELFNLLDTNHDGLIDVNELGKAMEPFYLGNHHYRVNKKIWSVLSEANWIPEEVLVKKLAEAGSIEEGVAEKCVKDVNFEGNPNVTFWQFLRAIEKKDGAQNIKELVNNSGLLFRQSKRYLLSIRRQFLC
jgi:Ca2+-binding EF-hand superfamily protein